jgi:ABC-type multidrug transport system ATPase subunit
MGSSGCGKTTLIYCIVGLVKLDAGEINVFGKPSAKYQRNSFGYMPQETALVGNFKIREMLWFFGTVYGMNVKEIEERIRFIVGLLELPDVEMFIENCSGGQKRRISFAVALIHNPDILILDEPTVGVDPILRQRIWSHLIELTNVYNVTVLMTTHYIEEARQSDRIGLMRNGVLITEESPQNVMQACGSKDLEKAFLRLSRKQSESNGLDIKQPKCNWNASEAKPMKSIQKHNQQKVIVALLLKHYFTILRNIR